MGKKTKWAGEAGVGPPLFTGSERSHATRIQEQENGKEREGERERENICIRHKGGEVRAPGPFLRYKEEQRARLTPSFRGPTEVSLAHFLSLLRSSLRSPWGFVPSTIATRNREEVAVARCVYIHRGRVSAASPRFLYCTVYIHYTHLRWSHNIFHTAIYGFRAEVPVWRYSFSLFLFFRAIVSSVRMNARLCVRMCTCACVSAHICARRERKKGGGLELTQGAEIMNGIREVAALFLFQVASIPYI